MAMFGSAACQASARSAPKSGLQSPSTAPVPLPCRRVACLPKPFTVCLHTTLNLVQFIYFAGFVGTVIACWVLRDYGGSALDFSPLNEARPGAAVVQGKPGKASGAEVALLFAPWVILNHPMLLPCCRSASHKPTRPIGPA